MDQGQAVGVARLDDEGRPRVAGPDAVGLDAVEPDAVEVDPRAIELVGRVAMLLAAIHQDLDPLEPAQDADDLHVDPGDRPELARPRAGIGGARLLLAALVVLSVLCLSYNAGPDALAPWMDNTITPAGILSTSEIYGFQPTSLTVNTRMLITAAVLVVLVIDSLALAGALVQPRRTAASLNRWVLHPGRVTLPAYALFLTVYFAALLPRCCRHMVFDRYLLPAIPAVAIAVCLRQQRAGRTRPPLAAWGLLVVFALFAVVSLQDITALGRVRIAQRNLLLSWGLTPQQMEMGAEFDHWAQLQATGFIPEVSLGRFDKPPNSTPDLKPIARLEYPRPPYTKPIRTVHYTSWLPPFQRTAYLDWLLQPRQATATTKP